MTDAESEGVVVVWWNVSCCSYGLNMSTSLFKQYTEVGVCLVGKYMSDVRMWPEKFHSSVRGLI